MRHALLIICLAAMAGVSPAAAQQTPFYLTTPQESQLLQPPLQPDLRFAPQPGPQPALQPGPRQGPISLLPSAVTAPDAAQNADQDAAQTGLTDADPDGTQTPLAPVAAALDPADLTPDRAALEAAIPFGGGASELAPSDSPSEADAIDPNAEPVGLGALNPLEALNTDALDPGALNPNAPDPDAPDALNANPLPPEALEPEPDVIAPYALVTDPQPRPGAVLRVLNQRAGDVETLTAQAGDTLTTGALSIRLETCVSGARPLDAAALVVIRLQDDPQAAPLFAGWMSAAAPSLATLQHPDYDVWVARCITAS